MYDAHDHAVSDPCEDQQALMPERVAELRRVSDSATPGPWVDYTESYRDVMYAKKLMKKWHGPTRWFGCLIASGVCRGRQIQPERDFPYRVDAWDMNKVMCVPLGSRVYTRFDGFVSPEDRAFICAARTAVPQLLNEREQLMHDRDRLNWILDNCDAATLANIKTRDDIDRHRAKATA